jgi:transcription factor C subunit 3
VGTHFVIHKYFYERSCSWKAIREEEQEAEGQWMKAEEYDLEDADQPDLDQVKQLNFTPIDARHLSSYPLISQRVIKLLRTSKNYMHASNDLLVILVLKLNSYGFSNFLHMPFY